MSEKLEEIRSLFFKNYEIIKNAYPWEKSCIYPVCASFYTLEHKEVDIDRLKNERRRIKEDTGIFSCFRGNLRFPLAALLSLNENPEALLRNLLDIHKRMREFCKPTLELAVVSCVFSLRKEQCDLSMLKQSVTEWRLLLKDSIKGLKDQKQLPYLYLIAALNQPHQEVEKQFLKLLSALSPYFRNRISSVAAALCLCKKDKDCNLVVQEFIDLLHQLKSYDACQGSVSELALVCMLSRTGSNKSDMVAHIVKNREEFQNRKYFGNMDSGALQKNFYAMALEVINQSVNGMEVETELLIMTELLTFVALPELIENMER